MAFPFRNHVRWGVGEWVGPLCSYSLAAERSGVYHLFPPTIPFSVSPPSAEFIQDLFPLFGFPARRGTRTGTGISRIGTSFCHTVGLCSRIARALSEGAPGISGRCSSTPPVVPSHSPSGQSCHQSIWLPGRWQHREHLFVGVYVQSFGWCRRRCLWWRS